MPTLTGPMFSVEARKALGKAITYQRRPGKASVYGYKKPKVPLTYLQVQQRGLIAAATACWQSLSDVVKAEWEAKARGQGQSGYSYWIRQYCELNFDRPLWLPMNEGVGATTADRSGYRNNGNIVGASWVSGKFGYALSFNGMSSYVSCGNKASLNNLTSGAVRIWAKLPHYDGITDYLLYDSFWESPYGHMVWRHSSHDVIAATLKNSVGAIVEKSVTFTPGELFMFGWAWDGAVVRFLKNEKQFGEAQLTGTLACTAKSLFIGAMDPTRFNLEGVIAEVELLRRAPSVESWARTYRRERHLYEV